MDTGNLAGQETDHRRLNTVSSGNYHSPRGFSSVAGAFSAFTVHAAEPHHKQHENQTKYQTDMTQKQRNNYTYYSLESR